VEVYLRDEQIAEELQKGPQGLTNGELKYVMKIINSDKRIQQITGERQYAVNCCIYISEWVTSPKHWLNASITMRDNNETMNVVVDLQTLHISEIITDTSPWIGSSGEEIPSGSSASTIIKIPNNSGVFLEGLKITYKINEPIKFTLVLKEGQKCGATEISIIDAYTSKFVSGINIDPSCNSRYLPQDSKIDIPVGDQNTPFKIDQPGAYKILVSIDSVSVFENGFNVRSIIPR